LFHLLNRDLCYANLNPTSQPEVWRDFGNNNQRSAVFRPWMPCFGNYVRPGADAREDAVWSARRDPMTGYGIALFDVDPGPPGGDVTTIQVTYLHAPRADPTNPNTGVKGAPDPTYTVFETFTLTRPRRSAQRVDNGFIVAVHDAQ
jgi:hypothetical protein